MKAHPVVSVSAELVRRYGWAPLFVFLLHVFISRVLNGYILYPPLDIPMHFFGGVAIAYFFSGCAAALPSRAVDSAWRARVHLVLVLSLTATASVFWEFAEFTSDTLFGTHAQLDLDDTLLDMALGIAGGAAYALMSWRQGLLGVSLPVRVRHGAE
jgi:hypothetical protein